MNKKSAFTIAEVLIAMSIIGIVVTFGLKAAIQNDKGIRHVYSNTYHVLDRALYNSINFPENGFLDPFADKDGNRVLAGRQGRGDTINADEGTERLCRALTSYINTVESNPCDASNALRSRSARRASRFRLISDTANDNEFTDANVQFTATNGVRYFISRRMPYANIGGDRALRPEDAKSKFYIIYADINGPKFPNSLEYRAESDNNHRNRSKDPDIFAFAAMEFGRVVPLGPPEFDGRFMLSRIAYFNTENNRDNESLDILYSKMSQPYYLSKAQAWGYYNSNSGIADDSVIEDNPYSYNGYIKKKLNPNTRIYSFVNNYFRADGQVIKVPSSANIKSATIPNGGYNCTLRSDEECDVIIDKYVF